MKKSVDNAIVMWYYNYRDKEWGNRGDGALTLSNVGSTPNISFEKFLQSATQGESTGSTQMGEKSL